jgi:probable rRNA maturation factor
LKRRKNVIIDITFLSKDEMRRLNFKYRGIDRTTSSLTFPYGSPSTDEKIYIGEILLNEEILKKKFDKFAEVIIHAYLHLAGYNHSKQPEREEMFKIQRIMLKELRRKKWAL